MIQTQSVPSCARLLVGLAVLFAAANGSAHEHDLSTADAWRGYGKEAMPEAWQFDDAGILSLDGKGGDLITRKAFTGIDFQFEWKISVGGNSGVMYLVSESDKPSYFTGPEYQVLDNENYGDIKHYHSAGALYELYDPAVDATKPAGQWNKGRIVLDPQEDGTIKVEHWLNDKKTVDAVIGSDDWDERVRASKFHDWKGFGKNRKGHLVLQDHGNKVWYRNLTVEELH